MIELGFVLALISAIGYSLNQIFNKILIRNGFKNFEAILLINFFLTLISFIIMITIGKFDLIKYDLIDLSYLISAGIFGFIALYSLFKSFKKLLVSESLAIANIYPFITLILTYFILNKIIKFIDIIIMFIVLIGIYILIENKKNKNSEKLKIKYILFPLITGFGWGYYGFVIYYLILENYNIYGIIFYLEFLMFLFSLLFFYKNNSINNNNIKSKIFNKKNLILAFLGGIFTTIGSLFFGLGTKYLSPAIVSSIGSSQIMFSIIFSYFLLNEKIKKKQLIGFSIILIGLILFNLIN